MMTGWLSTAERASGNHRNARREQAWMENKNKGSWKNINQSSSEEFSINFLPTTNYTRKDFNSFQIFYFLLRHNFQFPAVCAMVLFPGWVFCAPTDAIHFSFNRVKRVVGFHSLASPSKWQWMKFPHSKCLRPQLTESRFVPGANFDNSSKKHEK